MKKLCLLIITLGILTSCSRNYYVVRHAEKESAAPNMTSDVSLSALGSQRANSLRDLLSAKRIGAIYSTNTLRTRSTAEPLSKTINVPMQLYGPMPDSNFIAKLRGHKRNVLVVGHSNTVDDLVNGLAGRKEIESDLDESEYDNLFVVKLGGFLQGKPRVQRLKYNASK